MQPVDRNEICRIFAARKEKNDVLDLHSDSVRHHNREGDAQGTQEPRIPLADGRRLSEDIPRPGRQVRLERHCFFVTA